LGRLQVETMQGALGVWAPALNIPFVTTRELFVLKLGPAELVERYLAASAEDRREILDAELAGVMPDLADAVTWTTPRNIDTLEWFASAADMCRTMASLMNFATRPGLEPVRDILSLNPGLALDPSVWTYAAFKGGSEPGVLSGTWLLERTDGRAFVFTMSLNDPTTPIPDDVLVQIATAGIAQLAGA
jgi:hypothetical protein